MMFEKETGQRIGGGCRGRGLERKHTKMRTMEKVVLGYFPYLVTVTAGVAVQLIECGIAALHRATHFSSQPTIYTTPSS